MKRQICIDPDLRASGYSITENRKLIETGVLTAENLILKSKSWEGADIHIEASWLRKKANWRTNKGSTEKSQSQSLDAGRNQGVGIFLHDFFKGQGFKVSEIMPFVKPKGWKVNGTWTPEGRRLFSQVFKDVDGRLNDDIRDAVYCSYRLGFM
jgi:hypothetical protein